VNVCASVLERECVFCECEHVGICECEIENGCVSVLERETERESMSFAYTCE